MADIQIQRYDLFEAAAWGPYASARGVVGSYLLLSEWQCDEDDFSSRLRDQHWKLVGTKMVRVDGETITIKENIWYSLSNGEEDVV